MKNKTKIPHLTIRKSNIKIVERGKFDTPNTKYMAAHFPGFV